MTCDELETAIDQRLRGSLPPEVNARLDQHLAGCESCRRYETSARAIDASLGRHASHEMGEIDMQKVRDRLEPLARGAKRRLALRILAQTAFLGAFAWCMANLDGDARHEWHTWLIASVLFVPIAYQAVARDRREAKQIVDGTGDMLAWWRARVDREIATRRVLRWAAPVAIVLLGQFWWQFAAGRESAFLVGALPLLLASIAYSVWAARSLRQLRRERASLR